MTHPEPVSPPVLALREVSKSFGAVRALRGVSLALRAGEAHALAGENGAGKSTLIKTLAGVHRPDAGSVLLDGEPVVFGGPADARDAGVAVIYQEPTLFPDLSVAENIFVGRQPRRAFGRVDHRAVNAAAAALFRRLGVDLDPDQPARGLSIADQQLVEIAKALSFDARVLIMDEPTAALTGSEVARLFGVVRTLRDQGAAVLFISHRLEEIFALCQRVTTLRDGAWIADEHVAALTEDDLVRRMVGRDLDELYPKQDTRIGEVALKVARLTREGVFTDVSFDVRQRRDRRPGRAGRRRPQRGRPGGVRRGPLGRRGGAGRRGAAAQRRPEPGDVGGPRAGPRGPAGPGPGDGHVHRAQHRPDRPACHLPGRTGQPPAPNAAGPSTGRCASRSSTRGWPTWSAPCPAATSRRSSWPSGWPPRPKVLIVDEPTRGIDVGTKAEVHRLLSRARRRGGRGADDLLRPARRSSAWPTGCW